MPVCLFWVLELFELHTPSFKRTNPTIPESWDSEAQSALLTLRIGFFEGVASIHEAGGSVMLILQLEMQLSGLAEGIPSSWE